MTTIEHTVMMFKLATVCTGTVVHMVHGQFPSVLYRTDLLQ